MPEDFAFPLSEFYTRTSLALPRMEVIPASALPEPHLSLLAHEHDMTPTLERFHSDEIHIHALRSEQHDGRYFRQVVLRRNRDDAPVEFGANCLDLTLFTPEARWMILQEKVPLGRILKDHAIAHQTRAQNFFQVDPDELICRALELRKASRLNGRQAMIRDREGRVLSQVVEILPPLHVH
jgi:chorismate-pyruvate lyase